MAEALKSSCKGELIHNERRSAHAGFWRGRAEVDGAAAAWIRWCHTARPRLALDGIAPRQAENRTRQQDKKEGGSHHFPQNPELGTSMEAGAGAAW